MYILQEVACEPFVSLFLEGQVAHLLSCYEQASFKIQ